MSNYVVPFQIAALGGGPFVTMRRATLDLVTSTVSQFLHSDNVDRAHLGYMGCAHPGRQTDEAYDDIVVTNWNAGQEKGHIVHHDSASAASSAPRRDGAHIVSSWTAQEGSDVSSSTVQEEEIPSSLEPTPLVPGISERHSCGLFALFNTCSQYGASVMRVHPVLQDDAP